MNLHSFFEETSKRKDNFDRLKIFINDVITGIKEDPRASTDMKNITYTVFGTPQKNIENKNRTLSIIVENYNGSFSQQDIYY